MEVRKGYKHTEVGVIPEDWGVSTVGDEFTIQLGKMLDSEKNIGVPKPYIGNRAVQWGRIELGDIGSIKMSPSDLQRFRLRNGDLLVCEGGEIGRAAIWYEPMDECYYQKALHRLRSKRGYRADLLMWMLGKWNDSGFLSNFVTQTSIAHLPKDKFEKVPLVVPTKAEQEAIAEALSDADALIESLTQLIAKKRQIKQGAMQELLTGKRRLPGFAPTNSGYKQTEVGVIPEDWEVIQLGETIESLEAGVSVNSDEKEKDKFGYEASVLKTSCVYKGTFFPDEAKKIIPRDIRRAKLNPQRDTIIFSRMNTPILVGECGYVGNDFPNLFLPDRLWMTRVGGTKPVNVRWLAYLLSFNSFNRAIKDSATGTSGSMKNISKESLLSVNVPYPRKPEQEAIAEVLSEMDAELAALEAKLAKARALKQGMMHELLTGRIRLV